MGRANFVREDADVRRQDLIAACAACLAEDGPKGASVRAICRRAGVSAGLLTHYFDGIDDLVLATYRTTAERVNRAVAEAMEAAGPDPRAGLEAYVTASFRPPVLDPGLLATWLAFWSLTKSDPAVARLHGELYADFRRGLELALRACLPKASADEVRLSAVALTALIDGLWLELCLVAEGPFTPAEAERLALDWLDARLVNVPAD